MDPRRLPLFFFFFLIAGPAFSQATVSPYSRYGLGEMQFPGSVKQTAMGRAGLLDEIGQDNMFGNIDDALNRGRRELGLPESPRPAFATPTVRRETPVGLPVPPEVSRDARTGPDAPS